MIKIAAVGIIVVLLSLFMKQYFKQLVLSLELVFLSVVIIFLFETAGDKLLSLSDYFDGLEAGEELFKALMKSTAVCLITKFSADICTENGNILVGDIIEISGRIMLIVISMPFIEGIIGTAFAFVQ